LAVNNYLLYQVSVTFPGPTGIPSHDVVKTQKEGPTKSSFKLEKACKGEFHFSFAHAQSKHLSVSYKKP
jgi:hypothetical protein